jgi:hypothetical protein
MSNALAVRKEVLLVPVRKAVPTSFVEALNQGWKVAHENTALSIDGRHRDGILTLKRRGFAKLSVPYTGSVKRGFKFGEPLLS